MKKTLLILTLLFAQVTFAQDLEIVEVEDTSEIKEIPFSIIEQAPIYEGCQDTKGFEAQKSCFSKKINKHILMKFNTDLANNLGLPNGRTKIICAFKIDPEGVLTNIKVRADHPKLKEEAIRVLNLTPKMRAPGIQRGEAVTVSYYLPIVFTVVGSKPKEKPEDTPKD